MNAYREKLSPSWWMVLATALFVPATLIIFLPLSVWVGLGVGSALWLGSWGILWFFSPTISVEDHHIGAGRARIEHTWVDSMEIFRTQEATEQRGTQLDARAWLVLRPWIDPVVKITLKDPNDPTPYWLISSKNPDAFVTAWQERQTT
jgi:hypothetical protein